MFSVSLISALIFIISFLLLALGSPKPLNIVLWDVFIAHSIYGDKYWPSFTDEEAEGQKG